MSKVQVDTIVDKDDISAPSLTKGAIVTGVCTATSFDGAISEWVLGADGTSHYTFTGSGLTGAENDPTLYLKRGQKYRFKNSSGGHPFRIQSTANGSAGTAYNDGVTNNDAGDGTTLEWDVQFDAPSVLYYQCTAHGSMGGKIYIGNSGNSSTLVDLNVSGVTTTGIATVTTSVVVGSAVTANADGVITAGVGTFGSIVSGAISGSTGTFTGDIDIADKIVHTGDTDTAIRFSAADTVTVETGGTNRITINNNASVNTLDVAGGARADFFVGRSNQSAPTADASIYRAADNTLALATSSTERLRIGSSGEIGIAGANYGTSGQVLTSGGSGAAVSWADAGGGEWTLLASGTPTSGTNATITESHFTSTYWRYKVVFNMNCTTQGLFGFQIKNSGGWVTGADYFHQQFYAQNTAAIHDYYNNGTFMRPFWYAGGGRQWRGTLHLWNPSASDGEKYWYYENVQALSQTTYDGSSYFWSGGQPQAGSFRSNTSAITGLRMYMEEGITERCGGGTDTAGVSQWVLYGAKSS